MGLQYQLEDQEGGILMTSASGALGSVINDPLPLTIAGTLLSV
jgi:hypothetical protein